MKMARFFDIYIYKIVRLIDNWIRFTHPWQHRHLLRISHKLEESFYYDLAHIVREKEKYTDSRLRNFRRD